MPNLQWLYAPQMGPAPQFENHVCQYKTIILFRIILFVF